MIPVVIPKFRINAKSLMSKGVSLDPRVVLKAAQKEILRAVRDEIRGETFSPRAKRALLQGIGTKLGPNSLRIVAKHPAFIPLIQGQKNKQMTWLTKATRPIPIITDKGELIFRSATPRSMARGRWYHPGRKPTTVLEDARKKTREVVKRRMDKYTQRQLREAMGKVR